MKKNSFLIFIVTIITINSFLILSCKKNNDTTTPITNTNNNNSIICNGNGKNTYFPLDSGNVWNYSYYQMDALQNQKSSLTVIGFYNHIGKTYARLNDIYNWMFSGNDEYFREDPVTHDIYWYYSNYIGSGEFLFIPGTPYLNKTWTGMDTEKIWKVTNMSASFITPACSYTGLLEITYNWTASSTSKTIYYFKKGVGLVAIVSPSFPSTAFKISSASIK